MQSVAFPVEGTEYQKMAITLENLPVPHGLEPRSPPGKRRMAMPSSPHRVLLVRATPQRKQTFSTNSRSLALDYLSRRGLSSVCYCCDGDFSLTPDWDI